MATITEKQLDHLKELLEERKQALEAELADFAKPDKKLRGDWDSKFPIFDEVFKIEEASAEVEEYINRLPVEQSLELRLRAVGDALKRINTKAYGICSNCKKPISIRRLEAMPETQLCLNCPKKKRS